VNKFKTKYDINEIIELANASIDMLEEEIEGLYDEDDENNIEQEEDYEILKFLRFVIKQYEKIYKRRK
jgi:hypothetical protein